jgi:hypothetical protein
MEYRELNVQEMLSNIFQLSKNNLSKFTKIFFIFILLVISLSIIFCIFAGILYLLAGGINLNLNANENPFVMLDNGLFKSILILIPLIIVFIFLLYSLNVFFTGVSYDLIMKSYQGEEWNMNNSIRLTKERFWQLFFGNILVFLILLGGLLICCIGIIPMVIFTSVVFPIILFENKKAVESISRSFNLISSNFWNIFIVLIVIFLFILSMNAIIIILNMINIVSSGNSINFNTLFISTQKVDYTPGLLILNFIIFFLQIIFSIASTLIITSSQVVIFFNQKIKNEKLGSNPDTESNSLN